MLNTKFQGNWPSGSGDEDFLRVFTIYGHGSHLGQMNMAKYINFPSLFALRLHVKPAFAAMHGPHSLVQFGD